MKLAELQRYFGVLVTAPTGAEEGLELLRAHGEPAPEFASVFGETAALPAASRINIYANMYFYRLRDALAALFPRTARRIGAERFHDLITDYLLEHPSTNPDIEQAGRALPGFLAAHPLAGIPGLHALARLEQARAAAFVARDAAPALTLPAVQARPPAALGELPVRPIPSLALVELDCRADRLWEALSDERPAADALPAPDPEPVTLLVWRREFLVYHRPALPGEREMLDAAVPGATFATLCEALAHREDAAPLAAQALARWLHEGLLEA